jgi:uncharacterized damage-inducible protein DinB
MLDKRGLARLLEYTVWANHRVLRACATLEGDDFRRELGGSFGTIRGTLAHVMNAEWLWLERFKGVSPSRLPDESGLANVVALRDRWTVIEEHRRAWLEALPEGETAALVRYRTLAGEPYEAPLWQLVQHLANHSTYHRGQVISMLKQVGARTVATDLVVFDREKK